MSSLTGAIVAVFLVIFPSAAWTASSSWTAVDGGAWSQSGNWSDGTIADGAGNSATFYFNPPLDGTATHLDSPRTIGHLYFQVQDIGHQYGNWYIDNNGDTGNVLTLAATDSTPSVAFNWLGLSSGAEIKAVITGSSGLALDGPASGTLVLSASNTYTGGTTIRAGGIQITSDASLGDPAGPIWFTEYGNYLQAGSNNVHIGPARTITLGSPQDGSEFQVSIDSNGFAMSIAAAIQGVGSLHKTGDGLLKLTGSNSYAGDTYVDGGTLNINSNAALGSGTTTLYFQSSAALQADADIALAASRTLKIGYGSIATIDTNGHDITIAGNIIPDDSDQPPPPGGDLMKVGDGKLTLSGSNSYSDTIVAQGTLLIENSGALPSGTSLTVGDVSAFATAAQASIASPTTATPAPEPSSLVLIIAGVVFSTALRGYSFRIRR
jgi:autotransporter-associated beta strand protein